MADQFKILVDLDIRTDGSSYKKTEQDAKKAGERAGAGFVNAFKSNLKSQITSTIKSFAGIYAGVTAVRALTSTIKESVTQIRSFERAMANVNSILPQNEKLTKASADAFRDFAGQFGTTSAKQADAFYTIVSAGIKGTAKQLATLEASNEAAIAGLVDINDSARVLVSSVNAYATSGLTAARASDILFVAVREGQTTFQELANFIGNVAPVAASAGLKFEELAGTIAGVTKAGIKTDIAVTGIRALLSSLIKVTPEAREEAERLGLEFSTAALRAKGFVGFLKDVQRATGGNVEALGKLFPNVRALTPILQVVNGDFEDFARIQGEVQNSLGATSKAAEEIKKNLDFKLQQASANFDLLAQELTRAIVPALGDAAGSLSRWLILNRDSASENSKNKAKLQEYRIELEYWSGVMEKQGVPALKEWTSNATFAQKKVLTLTQSIDALNKRSEQLKYALELKESPYEKLIDANRRLDDLKSRLQTIKQTKGTFVEQRKSTDDFVQSLKGIDLERQALVSGDNKIQLLADIEKEKANIKSIESEIRKLKTSLTTVPDAAEETKMSVVRLSDGVFDFFKNIQFGFGKFSSDFKTRKKEMEAQATALAKHMKGAIAGTISSGIQEMVMAMREGRSEFDAFSKVFLQMVGDMAIKVGETLILTGIGINSLTALDGFKAIAAGAGLVAIGTIIKASAGGGASSGAGGSSGGGLSGTATQDSTEILTAPDGEQRQPNTNVEIVVQGSLVREQELGEFITETLNESFGKQGLTLTDARFA